MKKVIAIGLNPDYNYPGEMGTWSKNTTYYVSNLGASMVSRTVIEMFDADYVTDLENVEKYKGKYELCVLAFTNYATDWRDVSPYADFVEKLNIPTALFSLGVQDYVPRSGQVGKLHPSIKRILNHVSNTTGYIGVRGFHTAGLLYKEGYNNVIPLGCPSMYRGRNRNLSIHKPAQFTHPVFVFHRTFADAFPASLIEGATILGQDFLDEAIFTNNHPNDPLRNTERDLLLKHKYGAETLAAIERNGVFYPDYQRWFDTIGASDFVFGPRLHGCLAGLIQGKPVLLTARDLRVKEIAAFFKIPVINYEDYRGQSLKELYDSIDYTAFNALYPRRYDNFIGYLTKAGILKYFQKEEEPCDIHFTYDDMQEHRVSVYQNIESLHVRLNDLESRLSIVERSDAQKLNKIAGRLIKIYRKIR